MEIGYYPDKQVWCKTGGGAVGMYQAVEITPLMLARDKQLPGLWVELEGSSWRVPVARQPTIEDGEVRWSIDLPRSLEYVGTGWTYGPVVRRYQYLFEIANRWMTARFETENSPDGQNQVDMTVNEAIDMAAAALGANYRVSQVELSMLGVLTQFNWATVLDALVDMERLATLLDSLKKTAEPQPERTLSIAAG